MNNQFDNNSLLLVVSGPSGVGKGTICKELLKQYPNVKISTSVTTRKPRDGEVDGVSYFFKNEQEYQELKKQGAFLETFEIFGNHYGTLNEVVDKLMESNNDVLLEIDVQGGIEVKKKRPEAILIFIIPPSMQELASRLSGRGSETEESFNRRLGEAKNEIKNYVFYDYVVKNDSFELAVCDIIDIIKAEKMKRQRNEKLVNNILGG